MKSPHKREDLEAKYDVVLDFPNLELHSAAASGNVGLVHYALTHGQPVNSVLHGVLPLHAACSGGSVSVVRMLIENGADVNAPRLPRRYSDGKKGTAPSVGTAGSTPLHFAAANGHAPIVQMLLASGADPTKPDKNGNTAEDLATINGHDDVVRVLHVYHHLRHQDALNDPSNSDKAESSSPPASSSQLPEEETSSVNTRYGWSIGSRKGKERAFSLISTGSEGGGKIKHGLGGLLRRTSKISTGPSAYAFAESPDTPGSEASGPVYEPGSNTVPRFSTISDVSSVNDSLQSPIDMETPGSPSPQKGNDAPLVRTNSEMSGQGSPVSLTRVGSGQSGHSNGTSIILGSPPNSAGLPPQRSRLNSTSSHRPTLPSILEKAVHPGQTFRAVMRHHHDKDNNQSSADSASDSQTHIQDDSSHTSSGGFFRGRRRSHDADSKKHGHGHKQGIKSLFRRGHSPPSRSPSPPMKSEATKPIAAEDLEEGIERLKRASLEMDRQNQSTNTLEDIEDSGIDPSILEAISLNDEDEDTPQIRQMPLSAPVTKTRFFPDGSAITPRIPSSAASSPGERPPNRPRTGSEVIAPSPLANGWAHDDDSDSSLPQAGIRRVKTEIIKSPISSSPLSPANEPTSPTSPGGSRRRSATHSGGLSSPLMTNFTRSLNPPRVNGLGWDDDVDLRKVAASGLIRRESQRRQAEVDNELEAEKEEFYDALGPGFELKDHDIGQPNREDDNDSTPTPHSGMTVNDSTPTADTEDESIGRLRGASVGSMTTDSSRLSTPPASFRMTSMTDDTDDPRNQNRGLPGAGAASTLDGRPRGKSVSSIASTASGMGYSYAQSTSTPPTSLTTPSALSLALVGASGGFPPVPEDEVAPPLNRRTLTQRTISSHAEAKEAVKQNESDIMQLAQLPPSLDSSRSLAEQLAAYGENYAIERQFAEIERRSSGQTPTSFTGRSEDNESFFSAESSNRSYGSSQSSERSRERRGPGSMSQIQPRALSNPLVPLVSVDAPKSSLPSINNIYDKRADAYRKHMAALSAAQPLLPSSTRHAQKRARQRAVSAQEMWQTTGPSNNHRYSRPTSSHSMAANSIMSFATANENLDNEGGYSHIPVVTNPVTGQRPRKTSGGVGVPSHSRTHTAPAPIADILSTRYQGISPPSIITNTTSRYNDNTSKSNSIASSIIPSSVAGGSGSTTNPLGVSPYVSIFSNRYQSKIPLNDDDSDDENDNNREYTVIENDWRGGHIVRPNDLNLLTDNEQNKSKGKWGLKKMSKGLVRK